MVMFFLAVSMMGFILRGGLEKFSKVPSAFFLLIGTILGSLGEEPSSGSLGEKPSPVTSTLPPLLRDPVLCVLF